MNTKIESTEDGTWMHYIIYNPLTILWPDHKGHLDGGGGRYGGGEKEDRGLLPKTGRPEGKRKEGGGPEDSPQCRRKQKWNAKNMNEE